MITKNFEEGMFCGILTTIKLCQLKAAYLTLSFVSHAL